MSHSICCPRCSSADIRKSRWQEISELPKMLIGVYAFRCLACGERFFGNILSNKSGYATCPKCLRYDIQPASKTSSRLTLADKIRVGLNAQVYRCMACRVTFSSFRDPKPGETESPQLKPARTPEVSQVKTSPGTP